MIPDENTFAAQTPLYSITDPTVVRGQALDAQSPFDFYNFLKFSRKEVSPVQFNTAYQQYLKDWSNTKQQTAQQQQQLIRDNYIELLKDITLNYLSYEERRFIKSIDFTNDSDLDIVLPFYSRKLREICKFYSEKREKLKHQVRKFQEKGTNRSVENAIFDAFTDYITVGDDENLVDNVPAIKLENILNNLQIEIEELYDVYSSYLDNSPQKQAIDYDVTDKLRTDLYTANINDVEYDLFIDFDHAIKRYLFENLDIFLQGLGESFAVNYNIDAVNLNCKPDEKLYDIITNNKDEATRVLNLRKRLIQKYIGADFYYIKTGSTATQVASGVLFKADNPSGNLLNRHYPTTASVEEKNSLVALRSMGLFFRPEKNGLLYFSAPASRYQIDYAKLEPNKVYIFPDPSLYGNTTGLTNEVDQEYPLIHIQDYTSNIQNASYFHAEGDIKASPYQQSFYAYYTRNQLTNNKQTNYDGLSTNLASVVDRGKLVQWSEDIFGNQYGLFFPSTRKHITDYTTTQNQSVTAYEYYDGGIVKFYREGFVPEPISSDVLSWVYPNIFASDYYYNALFDGGIGNIYNGIMVRALRAPIIYDGLYFVLSAAQFSTTLNELSVNNINISFDTGITIDCGLFTDPVIYEGNLTLTYIISSIQYREMDGGPIIRTETGDIARDTGKNLFLTEVLQGCETQIIEQNQPETSSTGTIYIKDVVTGITTHLSAAYQNVLQKYSADVQSEMLSCVRTFNVYSDMVYIRTNNYFVVDKVSYQDSIVSRSVSNNHLTVPISSILDVSEPFFFEDRDYALMCVVEVTSAQSNNCIIEPKFYKILSNASLRTASISGLALNDTINSLGVKIKNIVTPIIVYNSRNDLYALLCTVFDANNVSYIYQMFFEYKSSQIVSRGVRMISVIGDANAQTINWYDNSTIGLQVNNITTSNIITVDTQQGALIVNG